MKKSDFLGQALLNKDKILLESSEGWRNKCTILIIKQTLYEMIIEAIIGNK